MDILLRFVMDTNPLYASWNGIWGWVITVKPDISAIERAAASGADMNEELCIPDMWLFLALRELYKQFRGGIVSKEQARQEKSELLSKHELARFFYDSYKETVDMRNRISSKLVELEKCGCEHCKELIRIFDGRQKPD